ncbi:hypothetical protein HanPSC8_Chr03g0117671 [Helianthus annuus]|nr:hypothetical protein HanPSC8_Chr03g0117671 [Helianthus annuus]
MNKVKYQVYEDRATLPQLKKCFRILHVGLFTRDQVSINPAGNALSTSTEFMAIVEDIGKYNNKQSFNICLHFGQ